MATAAVIQWFQECANKILNQTLKTQEIYHNFMLVVFEDVYATLFTILTLPICYYQSTCLELIRTGTLSVDALSEGRMEKIIYIEGNWCMKDTQRSPQMEILPELQIQGIHSHLVVMVYIYNEEWALILKKVICHVSNRFFGTGF